jgi:hypothetical protein
VAAKIGVVTVTIGVVTATTAGATKPPLYARLATTNEHPFSGVFGCMAGGASQVALTAT